MTNKNCIIRLSRYKNSLHRLKTLGFVKVFSDNLADAVGVTSEQVRKDFSLFGITGNKRGGYTVDALTEKLNTILGKDRVQNVIVVGLGNIGTALTKYRGFEKECIKITAAFEADAAKCSRKTAVPILPVEEMPEYIRKNSIKIGIIAVPDVAAQQTADIMIGAGIRGILNFAPISLRCSEDVVINNVNLELELESVIYFVNTMPVTESTASK
ncbi:MAG: redox-sensing transcriptional repressor Rex [Elusimicrobia bacterium]|nr:redox-sensing transcriptional repressor Rex [Elusimicrobiota bacterium]